MFNKALLRKSWLFFFFFIRTDWINIKFLIHLEKAAHRISMCLASDETSLLSDFRGFIRENMF